MRPPGGHYSHGVAGGGLMFVSGQLPLPIVGEPDTIDFETQVRRSMASLFAVLAEAGAGPDDLLKVTIYLVGIERWNQLNSLYAELMGSARPARSIVPVPALHFGYLVEIDAIAKCGAAGTV